MSTWSEVHTMTSTTENVSLQESRNGDSLTFDPTVVHSEVANASDEFPQDDHFEFDIDVLKDQLGIDHIMQSLNALRTFALIVSAHPYCARKFTCYVMHRARALNTKPVLNNNRADGHCYSFAWI